MKCKWLQCIGGMWRCTHPINNMEASVEFCHSDRDDAEAMGRDCCDDYYSDYE